MARNNEIPEVNAGSMADIAFLLLIFFLVTATIQTDMGLDRKLPPKEPSPPVPLNERNVLRVVLNKNDELMVESELLSINELRSSAVAFLDNGSDTKSCNYCGGERDPYSSENPDKAIISLNSDREASYGMYVKVQNELTAAYMKLRNRESLRLYGLEYSELEGIYNDSQTSVIDKKQIKDKITTIRNLFPMRLSEAETRQSLK
ncbi:biopolymer transporter ExbD [Muricauda sp. 2012CJ35-5]|uniref:Biopolymer transporter ExbD n=1 Tax=Flagellimonas spongiicola TaxID=2942208 RepID=A0ABT0PUZ1_9FLAO|nr:biopolymer transporter ExbD [Allomuricauda spongiicola]MCL6274811.1 biopolymer transporter ExbD [Allomuricauda spongiicola]